jgi:hypothetical protein
MVKAIKKTVTIEAGGRVEITSEDLPEGRQAEVIVLVEQDTRSKSYLALFGSGKDGFSSPEKADAFIRWERDEWES